MKLLLLSLVLVVIEARLSPEPYFMAAPSDHATLERILKHKIYDAPGYSSLEEELANCEEMKLAWHKALKALPKGTTEQHVLYAYTVFNYDIGNRDQFYKILNTRIREWFVKPGSFFEFKHFVKIMVKQAAHHPKQVVLYRGASHDKSFIVQQGKSLLTSQFESTSLDKEQTDFFVKNGTLYKITTNHAIPVLENSALPWEKEYILPPYDLYKVVRTVDRTREKNYLEVDLELYQVD